VRLYTSFSQMHVSQLTGKLLKLCWFWKRQPRSVNEFRPISICSALWISWSLLYLLRGGNKFCHRLFQLSKQLLLESREAYSLYRKFDFIFVLDWIKKKINSSLPNLIWKKLVIEFAGIFWWRFSALWALMSIGFSQTWCVQRRSLSTWNGRAKWTPSRWSFITDSICSSYWSSRGSNMLSLVSCLLMLRWSLVVLQLKTIILLYRFFTYKASIKSKD